MEYKYAKKENYENYASGRVLYGFPGITNYPVRLANEIVQRCMSYLNKTEDLLLYDPCCGGAYALTVLGFLHNNCLSKIYGSDINDETLEIAKKNLMLLSNEGLMNRKSSIEANIKKFNKSSHKEALISINYFNNIISDSSKGVETKCFKADITDNQSLISMSFIADIIFVDVPYGDLVEWSGKDNQIDSLLNTILHVIDKNSVIAISHNKIQKINNSKFERLEKVRVGKRIVDILRIKEIK